MNYFGKPMQKKILIFDDDPDILEICSHILSEMGVEVFTRQDCKDVISDLKKLGPDAVLMDNWIPDTGGVKATRAIKADPQLKDIPVILFTASSDAGRLARESGADAYIEKPFDIRLLEEVVAEILERFKKPAS